MMPFRYSKGTIYEGAFRVPCIARWPGHIKPGTVENGIFSGLDWFLTFVAAADNPDIKDQLLKGVTFPTDMPRIYNIRQNPFERTLILNFGEGAPAYFNEFFGREAWRFVFVQDVVLQLGETAVDFPPMQAPASFSLTRAKEQIQEMINHTHGAGGERVLR